MSRLKQLLAAQVLEDYGDGEVELEMYNLDVEGWPEVKEDPYDESEDAYMEDLDMENWGITSLTDTELQMYAGGDWQNPCNLIIQVDEDDNLSVVECEEITTSVGSEMDAEEVIELLKPWM